MFPIRAFYLDKLTFQVRPAAFSGDGLPFLTPAEVQCSEAPGGVHRRARLLAPGRCRIPFAVVHLARVAHTAVPSSEQK
jgi:hypothetical protein